MTKTLCVQAIEATTANGVCTMRIKALALPGAVATALDENADLIRMTLAASAAPSSPDQPTAELSPNSQAAQHDNGTDTAPDTDTDRHGIKDIGSQNQHQPNRADSAIHGDAAAQDARGGGGDPPTAVEVPDAGGPNLTNGHRPSSPGTAHAPCSHGNDRGSTGGNENSTNIAEVQLNGERMDPPQLGQGAAPLGSGTESREGVPGSKGFNRSIKREANHVAGDEEVATTAPVNNADEHREEEGQSHVSGKVGILKQRLLAAAKEAKADSPALLKVSD